MLCTTFIHNQMINHLFCVIFDLVDKKEKEKIDEVFHAIDLDNNGTLDKEEVKLGYSQFFGRDLSDDEVDAIFKNVDTMGNGVLGYSEFVFG